MRLTLICSCSFKVVPGTVTLGMASTRAQYARRVQKTHITRQQGLEDESLVMEPSDSAPYPLQHVPSVHR